MIRIRLINEGKVVKQITSRVHEGVVLEQIKKYKDSFDTIQILEGELSEDAKSMLQHVARKIVPAAMAAGMALGGAGSAAAQGGTNPNYPGMNRSIGQSISDIVSPDYKEKMRQREYERETGRQEWNAGQDEIRKQRVSAARASSGAPTPGSQHVVYDQSRMSKDGKFYIIYGMDNKVKRIPVNGTEYMDGDSQRLPHYITSAGSVFYVRHSHMNESVAEGVMNKIANKVMGAAPEQPKYKVGQRVSYETSPMQPDWKDGGRGTGVITAYKNGHYMINGHPINHFEIKSVKQGMDEGYTVTRGIDRERYQERDGLEGPFSTKSGKVVYYDKAEGKYYDPDTDFYIGHEDYAKMSEDATVGTIPASGTSGTVGTSGSMSQRTQFAPSGKTTAATFNKNGQIELDTDPEADGSVNLDADAVKQLQQAGVKMNEGSDTLEGILSKYSADYDKFKAGGDIDENQDFFDALYEYYSNSGQMPYGVQKARDGDPYEWITDRLDNESGLAPVAEADGDDSDADRNIIMQIRKASDYTKPTKVKLADGSESVIAPNIARELLAKFDKMKPDSKELLQNTLNTETGFIEILDYFGGGVREQAAARVGSIMKAAMTEAGLNLNDDDWYEISADSKSIVGTINQRPQGAVMGRPVKLPNGNYAVKGMQAKHMGLSHGVAEATSAAVRLQRAADKQRAKSDASLARTPSSIPKKKEQGVAEHKGVKHRYQMTHPDGSKMKFTATDDADAKRQAKEHSATSLRKFKSGEYNKVAEQFNSEYDDEAGMAQSNLRTMARAVDGLIATIKDKDNLPEWAQEKIAKAELMTTGVWDYLLSQKEQGIDPKVAEASLAVMRDYFDQPDSNTVNIDNQYGQPERKQPANVPVEIQNLVNKMYHAGKITPDEFEILRKFQQQTKISVGLAEE